MTTVLNKKQPVTSFPSLFFCSKLVSSEPLVQGQPAAPSVPPLRYCCDKLFVITNDGGLLVGHLASSNSWAPSPSGVYLGGHFWEHRFMLPLILWSLASLCCWDNILVCAFSTKIYLLQYLLEEASFILGSFPSYLFMFPLLFCFSGPINLGLISTWRNRFNGSCRDYSSQDWSTGYSQMAEVLNLNSPQAEVSVVSDLPMEPWGIDLTTRP